MVVPYNIVKNLEKYILEFNPDVIHLHNPFLLCYAGLKIAKKLGKKTIFTHHSVYQHYLHYIPFGSQNFKEYLLNLRLKEFYKNVDHVIAPGTYVANDNKKFKPNIISVLPSPLLDVFRQPPIFNICKQKIKLITVARLVPEKNITYLIDVISILDIPYEYTIIGTGMSEQFLKKYAAQKNVKINFTGALPKEKIAEHYRQKNIFIFASKSETQGLVIAEALAAGRPVIALKASGVEDAVVDGYNGYLVQSKQDLCDKIKLLFADNLIYNEMQNNAYRSSLSYDPIVLTQRLIDCYKS
jgi:glycosyltransferase involved in cell wall biosynthesis